ncbi:hypothetical protein ACIBK8_25645 [Streptomyces sp. NPDC050161]|uniref:hypothetical protein n=1 Tax=Streptomyces sp. NPDC050161 TaxID=3365604 RepID=UPI0037BA3740
MTRIDEEPAFNQLDYVTISRDPRTQLVVAIGGTGQAAGILQTTGHFVPDSGLRGPYHRQPHNLPVDQQRQGATAAAHALTVAGFSVHLDPSLNTLHAPGGDREAALRYLDQLAERAGAAADEREVAAVLTEIAATHDGLLHKTVRVLIATWVPWTQRLEAAGLSPSAAERLQDATRTVESQFWRIQRIRDLAATTSPAPKATPSQAPAAAPSTASPAPRRR